VATAFGRVAARQLDQPLFEVAFDLDLVRSRRLRLVVQGRRQALRDQPLADTTDGTNAHAQGSDDLVIGVVLARGGIRQQEDAGVGDPACCAFADGNEAF
jgi:hypothetical protein